MPEFERFPPAPPPEAAAMATASASPRSEDVLGGRPRTRSNVSREPPRCSHCVPLITFSWRSAGADGPVRNKLPSYIYRVVVCQCESSYNPNPVTAMTASPYVVNRRTWFREHVFLMFCQLLLLSFWASGGI